MEEEGAYYKGFMMGDGSWHYTGKPPMPMLRIFKKKLVCVDRLISSSDQIPSDPASKFSKIRREHLFLYPQSKSDLTASGDGGVHRFGGMYRTKKTVYPYLTAYRLKLPEFMFAWGDETKMEFLAGLYDSDGHAHRANPTDRWNYNISSVEEPFLVDVKKLLSTVGIESIIDKIHNGKPCVIDGKTSVSRPLHGLRLRVEESGKLSNMINFSRITHWTPQEHVDYELWKRGVRNHKQKETTE